VNVSRAVWGSLALAALAVGCGSGTGAGSAPAKKPPLEFPVETERTGVRDVEYVVAAVGSVEAFETVQVVSRVPGAVERVEFAEGQDVKAGAVLVEIEPDRYRVEVGSAKAALERAEAELADARAILERREHNPTLFPVEDVDTVRTRSHVAEANSAAAKATLARAELNLRDSQVRAPVAGRIETRTVQTGQYVQPGAVLATIVRREPLLVRFEVPAPDAAALRPGQAASFTVPGDPRSYRAELTHVAGSANERSRTVAITASVTDPARAALRPGAFADVRVPVGRANAAPVIPQTAIRPSERGFLAFVVEDGTARERIVTLGLRTDDGKVEVRSGLSQGEVLVVRGAEALRDGARVKVEGQPAAAIGTTP
jgi:membrane fusion protein, multidrug efflux system